MNLVLLRYPNWYRGLLEGQVGNMPVRVRVSLGGLEVIAELFLAFVGFLGEVSGFRTALNPLFL